MNVAATKLFEIVPLSTHIGAEIRGLDLFETRGRADTEGPLPGVARPCRSDLPRPEPFAGRPCPRHEDLWRTCADPPSAQYFPPGFNRVLPGIMFISNIRENGEPIGALPDGEMMFHHDMIHHEIPDKGTLLYSIEIPSYGGNTLFASGYAAMTRSIPS